MFLEGHLTNRVRIKVERRAGSMQPDVDVTLAPDTTNMKLVARWRELVTRVPRATRFILVVSGPCVAAEWIDKSNDDQNRAFSGCLRRPGVDLSLCPETTNMKLVARWCKVLARC
jgi:hypothetical protein